MHQLHSFLLHTHYVGCTQRSVSEMHRIRHRHHLTELDIAEVAEAGFYLLLPLVKELAQGPLPKALPGFDGDRNSIHRIIRRSEFKLCN